MLDRQELGSRVFVALINEYGYEKIANPKGVTSSLPAMAKVALDAADAFIRIAKKFPPQGEPSEEEYQRMAEDAADFMKGMNRE